MSSCWNFFWKTLGISRLKMLAFYLTWFDRKVTLFRGHPTCVTCVFHWKANIFGLDIPSVFQKNFQQEITEINFGKQYIYQKNNSGHCFRGSPFSFSSSSCVFSASVSVPPHCNPQRRPLPAPRLHTPPAELSFGAGTHSRKNKTEPWSLAITHLQLCFEQDHCVWVMDACALELIREHSQILKQYEVMGGECGAQGPVSQ